MYVRKLAFGATVLVSALVGGSYSALANSVTLSSASNTGSGLGAPTGGNVSGGSTTVLENSGSYEFDIFGVTATRLGTNLTVTIYTNYANNVGAVNTGLGYLFFANGTTTTPNTYAASINYDGTTAGGANDHVYQPGSSNIQNSYYGNTNNANGTPSGNGNFTEPNSGVYPGANGVPCTTSSCNGGTFHDGHPVGVTTAGATSVNSIPSQTSWNVTESWSVTAGTTVNSHNQAAGLANANFLTDGQITFTLGNVFSPTGLDLGGPSGTFSIAWAMTCANDYIVDTFVLPPTGNQGTVPLPAALPLFTSGVGLLGLLNWRRKRKMAADTAVAA